jgi:hypothetical protein
MWTRSGPWWAPRDTVSSSSCHKIFALMYIPHRFEFWCGVFLSAEQLHDAVGELWWLHLSYQSLRPVVSGGRQVRHIGQQLSDRRGSGRTRCRRCILLGDVQQCLGPESDSLRDRGRHRGGLQRGRGRKLRHDRGAQRNFLQ